MKKTNIYTILILAFVSVLGMGSCRKEPIAGGTATQALAGEWWVKFDNGTGEDGPNYFNLSTYNTAANLPTEMWFDDDNDAKSFWDIKGKISCNDAAQTFSGTNIANQYYTSTFTVTNGKVFTGGAKASGTKDVTDSIYCLVSFSDDSPIVPHVISGYKRTGFSQDDH